MSSDDSTMIPSVLEADSTQPRAASLTDQFYLFIQTETGDLDKKISHLTGTSLTTDERATLVENCLTRISQLSQEVQDAAAYLPAYDQRRYTERIKLLTEKLSSTRKTATPKPRFAFKSARKAANGTTNLLQTGHHPASPSPSPSKASDPQVASSTLPIASPSTPAQTTTLTLTSLKSKNIAPKPSTPPSSAVITDTVNSIINLSHLHTTTTAASTSSSPPSSPSSSAVAAAVAATSLSTLTLKNLTATLLVSGPVSGPIHLTCLQDCTLLLHCHQFRMHDCTNVDVYLWCRSRPIIEGCKGIRFAPLPSSVSFSSSSSSSSSTTTTSHPIPTAGMSGTDSNSGGGGGRNNMWDQIDDFTWLRQDPNPHWSVLPERERIADVVWEEVFANQQQQQQQQQLKAADQSEKNSTENESKSAWAVITTLLEKVGVQTVREREELEGM